MEHTTRILAIRHGETAWNTEGRIQGHLDEPLNDKGRWQAQRLAAAVAHEDIRALYASNLARARETAQALASTTGLPIRIDTALRERGFGSFEGLTYEEIVARWPVEADHWRQRDVDFSPGGTGETLRAFYARCVDAVTRIAAQHPGETIAVVAHGGVMDCLYRAAARIELHAPRTWKIGNASLNRLLYTAEGYILVGWSDTHHLDQDVLDESAA